MTDPDALLVDRLATLRRSFDEGFASLPAPPPPRQGLLGIRLNGDPFALRLEEIAGLHGRRKIVHLPEGPPGLLGMAGLRGRLVAVYGLAQLLGREGGGANAHWLVECAGEDNLALAFDVLDGHLWVACAALSAATDSDGTHVRQILNDEAGLRPVLAIASLVQECRRRTGVTQRPEA